MFKFDFTTESLILTFSCAGWGLPFLLTLTLVLMQTYLPHQSILNPLIGSQPGSYILASQVATS